MMGRGTDEIAASSTTLVELLGRRARREPGQLLFTFLADGEGDQGTELSFGDLDRQARAVAARLRSAGLTGERALLLYAPGLEMISAFFGCLYAGVVAVPAHLPRPNRPMPRLKAIVQDCAPRALLTSTSLLADSERWITGVPELVGIPRLATDQCDESGADGAWYDPGITPETLAFLQYTSGSTSSPKGVMVTHGNLIHNSAMIQQIFGSTAEGRGVFWLPLFHDMGLIGGMLQTLYCGGQSTLMPPVAFLQRPLRWLQAISRTRATISGGPNFAYELCVRQITAEQKRDLDLSTWTVAFSGAEPVRAETIDRFSEAFADCGFRREAFLPCFGLAEGTLLVTGKPPRSAPVIEWVRAGDLGHDLATAVEEGSSTGRPLVSSGRAPDGMHVAIVDPETRESLTDGRIGEIWTSSPSAARGYWNRPEATLETFQATIAGTGEGPFLRTGDLGYLRNGELVVTGRHKDLILIRGRNIYPQDIERTVEECHPALRSESGAAFAIEENGEERLVVIHEIDRLGRNADPGPILAAIRQAIAEQHELDVHAIRLIKPLSIPKTSSGKIQRHACRAQFQEGSLSVMASWGQAVPEIETTQPSGSEPAQIDVPLSRAAEPIASWLVNRIATQQGIDPARIDCGRPFASFGLSSVQAVGLAGELEQHLGRKLSPTLVYEYPTIDLLARFLADGAGGVSDASSPSSRPTVPQVEPIAIIGIGCRFPGADGPDAFWALLCEGREAVREVPPDRWDVDALHNPTGSVPGRIVTRRGGFLDRVDGFDADFFGISPREAIRMDPQQRLLLEVTWEAIEDAGLVVDRLAGEPVGVFIGISTSDYARRLGQRGEPSDAHEITGNAASIAANRLSYAFDFRGPSLAIDTACSSSLVAVHQACQSLRAGDATLAIAGGVNLILAPDLSVGLSNAGFLSPEGRCRAFDAGANGYVRGEGLGVVVLKPLSRALADGDPIHAVIRGGAVNQDGRSNGLTAPNPQAQEAVLRMAYRNAGVAPGQVGYIEAHGTGTLLGDPIEVNSLGAVLTQGREPGSTCALGSVKTNIGHLESAAGIAGLIKATLILEHRVLPPSLNCDELSPHIPFDSLPIRVQRSLSDWPANGGPRIVGVSSFGFGGTNAHLVLEEAPVRIAPTPALESQPTLLALSARSQEALHQLASRCRDELASHRFPLGDIAWTAAVRRGHLDYRLALTASTSDEAISGLDAYLRDVSIPDLTTGCRKPGQRPGVVFVFSGQGSLWHGAGRDLFDREPVFRSALEKCDELVRKAAGWSLIAELMGDEAASRLDRTEIAQPVLFGVQVALAALWRSWGIEPRAVVGHSLGEVSAAHVAGVLTLPDSVSLVVARGRLMQSVAGQGETAAVALPADEVRRRIRPFGDQLGIAAINSPTATTVSGDRDALKRFVQALQDEEIFTRVLKVDCAFHSPQMDPVRAQLEAALTGLRPGDGAIPFFSTVTATQLPGRDLDASYWARNLRETVRFADAIDALSEESIGIYLEIGTQPVLGSGIAQELRARQREGTVLGSLRRGVEGRVSLLHSLGSLYATGQSVAWDQVLPPGCVTPLPRYPWQHKRFWIEPIPARPSRVFPFQECEPARPHPGTNGNSAQRPHTSPQDGAAGEITKSRWNGFFEEGRSVSGRPDTNGQSPEGSPGGDGNWHSLSPGGRREWFIQFLRRRVAKVLEQELNEVDPDRPLDTMGLDSVSAIELKWAIEDELKQSMPITNLMAGPTIAQLADRAVELVAGAEPPREVPVGEIASVGSAILDSPASYGQRSLWSLQHLDPTSAAYIVARAVRVRGKLDREALHRSFQRIVDRHGALRTTFTVVDGYPVQRTHPSMEVKFTLEDVSDLDDETIQRRMAEDAREPFDLEGGPLFRVHLLSRSETDLFLVISFHHSVGDFWSMAIIIDELSRVYAAERDGQVLDLPPLSISYAEFVRTQNEMLEGPEGEAHWAYWNEVLTPPLPTLDLATDRPRPAVQTTRGATTGMLLNGLSARIVEHGAKYGASLHVTLLAAFQMLLARESGQDDLIVGTPSVGRDRADLAGLVGYFVNPLPMRLNLADDPSFAQVVDRVRSAVYEGLEHQAYPFSRMVEQARRDRDPSRTPIFQVMFVFQRAKRLDALGLSSFALQAGGGRMELEGYSLEALDLDLRSAQFDMTLMAADSEDGLALSVEYNTDLFDRATINRLLSHYETLLESIVAQPETPLSALPILTESERRQLVIEWNATASQSPDADAVHRLIEKQAALDPGAIAVVCRDEEVTYAELNTRSNRLANHLRSVGVGPDILVGLCLDRSVDMIVAVLGTLKAGGAYVPLDPEYPPSRLAYLVEDARPAVLLTQRNLASRLTGSAARLLCLDEEWNEPAGSDEPLCDQAGPDNLAYVIYTSGSTGRPKGVGVTHRNLAASIHARFEHYEEPVSSFLLLSSIAFDSSVAGLFWTLCAGGKLVLTTSDEQKDIIALSRLIDRYRVSHLLCVPSLYNLILSEAPSGSMSSVRVAIVAGETCASSLVAQHAKRLPGAALFNEYGPTEATVWSSVETCRPGDGPVLIGRPIAGTRLHVLDRWLEPVPVGVAGELYIGGAGIARGYVNHPGLTAERFVPDPFESRPGGRIYRTGDLVRWRADGRLEFLGRIDHQIKIHGLRIELGEIEATLIGHPGIREVVVSAFDDTPGGPRLVAHFVPRDGDPGNFRAWLKDKLPAYMIPAAFVALEALPLTPNGKVNRRALPTPEIVAPAQDYVPPRTAREADLARIVADVLGIERVGIENNLFELGLDSIRSIQIVARAGQAGLRIQPAQLFQQQTIAELACANGTDDGVPPVPTIRASSPVTPFALARLDTQAVERLIEDQPQIEDAYPLSPVQEGMLFHTLSAPDSGVYVIQFTCKLSGMLDADIFEEAWKRLLARHPALRTSVQWADSDQPLQVVHRQIELPLRRLDWSDMPDDERGTQLETLLRAERETGFTPSLAPLTRLVLVRLSAGVHQIIWSNHHLLLDGWSMPVLLGEVVSTYSALRNGRQAQLTSVRPFREYIAWLQDRDLTEAEAYWRRTLGSFRAPTPLGIGCDPRGSGPGPHAEHTHSLPAELAASIGRFARTQHLTLNTLVLGAWSILLSRYGGRGDIVFGTVVSGRPAELPGVETMVGMFLNTLPMRVRVDEDAELCSWLQDLQASQVALRRHEASPLVKVQEWSGVPRGVPMFESVLVFENLPVAGALQDDARGLGISDIRFLEQTSYPITITVMPGTEITLRVGYDSSRFDTIEIENLVGHLLTLLDGMTQSDVSRLADLSMLRAVEQEALLHQWSPCSPSPGSVCTCSRCSPPDLDQLSDEDLDALIEKYQ